MLQDGRSEFANVLSQFDTATKRAMTSVTELQTVSKKIADALQLKIDKANFLADDLAFLIEKSNKLITQLEQLNLPTTKQNLPKQSISALIEQTNKAKTPQDNILHLLSSSPELAGVDVSRPHKNLEASVVPRTNAERELIAALKSGR